MLAALEDEKYANIRDAIIPLVKEIGDKEPTPFLFEQIYSPDRRRRCNACDQNEKQDEKSGIHECYLPAEVRQF